MARILAIDPDPVASDELRRDFESRGHRILIATTAAEGVRLARAKRPRIVVLAQSLPDKGVLDVCRTLKGDPATGRIPIVLLVDRPDAIERAVARELGAADYLVKPFPRGELVSRVEARLAEPAADPSPEPLRFGSLTVSSSGGEGKHVTVDGESVDLTPVELALLLVLCEGIERVYTREELRERVWGEDGQDATRLVDQYVKRLRKKLGKAALYIETVHGVGYRFAKGRAARDERDEPPNRRS